MRAYSSDDEESLLARNLIKDWTGEGFLTEAQRDQLQEQAPCSLRRTNIFLRLVLFFFTLIIVAAAAGLFFITFLSRPSDQAGAAFLMIFAGASYAATEVAVSQYRLYRYGIEEALAVCSLAFLCIGLQIFISKPENGAFLVPAVGVAASLWLWYRFGLAYMFLAAMLFAVWLAGDWTSSHLAQRIIVAAIFTTGLAVIAIIRSGEFLTHLDNGYSIAESLLWLGLYLVLNLKLSSVDALPNRLVGYNSAPEFPKLFYWTTWVLTWCLPPLILLRGLRIKDRFVIAAGAIVAILTLATNKPYLGWPRHEWDPMLLGALLIGVALFLRRWLAQGPDGIRHGFTARRLSGKDKEWMSVGSTALGLMSPHAIAQTPQPHAPEVHYGGGDSAGGGASSDY